MVKRCLESGIGRLVLVGALLALGGCASNLENAAQLLAERPVQTCTTTVDGQEVTFQGSACDRLAASAAQQQAMSACAGFAESNEPLCVLALAMSDKTAKQGAQDAEINLLIAAMQSDTQIKAAWIGTIPGIGQLAATAYQVHESEKTLRTALRNGGTRIGSVNVTKSDDGGGIASGDDIGTDGEGLPTGSGGNGDQYVVIGNKNQTIPGDGSIITRGRNPVLIGTGQPNSSLDPSNVFNQNATAPDNPINGAPVVETSDDDANDASILPGI